MDLKSPKDRYLWTATIIGFIVFIAFFSQHNLVSRIRLQRQIRELEHQKKYYMERIAEDSTLLELLKDNDFFEKYAREQYNFLRDGETIYLIK